MTNSKTQNIIRELNIELTNTCQLSCPLCPTGIGIDKRNKEYFRFDLFNKILSENKYLNKIYFWNYGEPTLHPDMLDFICLAKKNNIEVVLSTNGIKLAERDFTVNLLNTKLNTLIISLDGISKDIYEKYRIGGKFEDVMQGIDNCKNSNISTEIILQFIIMNHNEFEIESFIKFAEDNALGWDLKTVGNCISANTEDYITRLKPYLPSIQYIRKTYKDADTKMSKICPKTHNSLVVGVDGTVYPCCWDSDFSFPLGNISNESLFEIINGEKLSKLKRSIELGFAPKMCSYCPARLDNSEFFNKHSQY
jgi:radical SAM protein with 4Fe4S-binding SPASM domain